MGCVSSKAVLVSATPAFDFPGALRGGDQEAAEPIFATSLRYVAGDEYPEATEAKKDDGEVEAVDAAVADLAGDQSGGQSTNLQIVRLGNLHNYIEGEQVAAGWPSWLTSVAGEAIQGWVPLKADSYEKLEKVGQGTYSSVFRARDVVSGKIVALKKVRFDNFEPESVRFMAREIQILRRLDHPNVVKLEGLIASRLSCSLYLVFEYMEHDLAGLSSSPDIKFTESQIKCYMQQLLSGVEHCHDNGIIHRDIKGANVLVNNEGILKVADFGLANFWDPGHKKPLTSRVVTLWYRPPELLLGSTDYEASVDLWSAGCVFAEMFTGKPILQGRTEVEQLHKIFKLCGSPPDEYWKKSKLPHATIFKPHHPYESCLHEKFKNLPESAVRLLETLLFVEPYKRGTASTALASEYFRSEPYPCEPSSLPKYAPNKEIDAKNREESQRRRGSGRARGLEATRKPSRACRISQEPCALNKVAESQEGSKINANDTDRSEKKQGKSRVNGETRLFVDLQPMPTIKPHDRQGRHRNLDSQEDISFSGPLLVNAPSSFSWAKRNRENQAIQRSHSRSASKSHLSGGIVSPAKKNPRKLENGDARITRADPKGIEPNGLAKRVILKKWSQLDHSDSFNSTDIHHPRKLSLALSKDDPMSRHKLVVYEDQGDRVEFSGPLLSQTKKVDELLQKHERHIRQAVRRSWLRKDLIHRTYTALKVAIIPEMLQVCPAEAALPSSNQQLASKL